MKLPAWVRTIAAPLAACLLVGAAVAQEAVIRKTIAERFPDLPKIDEVTKTPIPGLYEVRIGIEIYYSDEQGNYLLQGTLLDTKTKTNLTEARIEKLTAVAFDALPFKDAIVIKQGNGKRRLAVFVDPNCGYCKRFERDLLGVKDVTIYTFLYPILGPDSDDKSRSIWCSREAATTWRAWMVNNVAPPKHMGSCDTAALERNREFGRKHHVTGTPALFFENGTRKPGALPAEMVEKLLVAAKKP